MESLVSAAGTTFFLSERSTVWRCKSRHGTPHLTVALLASVQVACR